MLTDRWLKQQSAAAANNDDEPCTSSSLVPNTQRNKPEVKRKEKRFSDEQVIQLEEYYITVGNPMNYDEIGTISKKLGTNKIRIWKWLNDNKAELKKIKQAEGQNFTGSQLSSLDVQENRKIPPNSTQKQILNSIVEKGIFPSLKKIEKISKDINCDEIRIYNWLMKYFNRRKKVPSANNSQAQEDSTVSFPEINITLHQKGDHHRTTKRRKKKHVKSKSQKRKMHSSAEQGQPSSSHQSHQQNVLETISDKEDKNIDNIKAAYQLHDSFYNNPASPMVPLEDVNTTLFGDINDHDFYASSTS